LYAAHVLNQGVAAMNEAQLLADDDERKHLRSRLAASYLRRGVSKDVGLTTGADVADALDQIGLPRMAKMLRHGDPAVVFDLRDIGGYQTWLHNIRTDLSGPEYYLQFGPLGGLISQVADPQSRDPYRYGTGVPEGTPGTWPHFAEYAKGLLAAASPTWANRALEGRSIFHQAIGSAKAVESGEAQRMYPRGPELTPLDAMGQALGPLGMSTVDGLAMADAIKRRIKGMNLDTMRKAAMSMGALDPKDPDQLAQLGEQRINALAKTKQLETALGWLYGTLDRQQFDRQRERIEGIRRDAIARAKGKVGGDGKPLRSWWDDSSIAAGVAAVQRAVADAMDEVGL
jgi:hypothetical protein